MLLNQAGNTKPGLQDGAGLSPACWEILGMSEALYVPGWFGHNQELRLCPFPAHKETKTLSNPILSIIFFFLSLLFLFFFPPVLCF